MISEEDRLFQLLKQCRLGFFDKELMESCLKFLSRRSDYMEHPIYKEIVTWILNDNGTTLQFCFHYIKSTNSHNLIPGFYPYTIKIQSLLKETIQELHYLDLKIVKCPLFRSIGEINFICERISSYQMGFLKQLKERTTTRYTSKEKIFLEIKDAIISEIEHKHESFSVYKKTIANNLSAYFLFRFQKYESAQFFLNSMQLLLSNKVTSISEARLNNLSLINELYIDNLPDESRSQPSVLRLYQGSILINF
jgi:hypothetical protein